MAASGTYDLGFALFDAETGGNLIGTAVTRSNISVTNGIFTVQLDFGANAFATGANRFLQIAVKKTSETDFTNLTPRQQLTSSRIRFARSARVFRTRFRLPASPA